MTPLPVRAGLTADPELADAILLLAWWLEWYGHPGYADPRCWASDEQDYQWSEDQP